MVTPSLSAQLFAMSAQFDVLGQRAREAGEAIAEFTRAMRRALAGSLRALPREQRRTYWAWRQAGEFPMEALRYARANKQAKG